MKAATFPLLRGIGNALIAAYTAAGRTCPWSVNPSPTKAFPFGVLGTGTENDGFSTKTTDGGVLTHTLRIYDKSDAGARELGEIAIEALTDRDNPITLDSPFYQAGRTELDMFEIIPDRDERGEHFGALIRLRYRIGQHE